MLAKPGKALGDHPQKRDARELVCFNFTGCGAGPGAGSARSLGAPSKCVGRVISAPRDLGAYSEKKNYTQIGENPCPGK